MSSPDLLAALRAGGKPALAAALARLESAPDNEATLALLDAAEAAPRAHVIGITGPPGVGKSTLAGALVRVWRRAGRRVGVVAVDPSSRRSGGALLGDRTRLQTDGDDRDVFVRSQAARDRLGGLASLTVATTVVMRALFDVVLVETVGVGQSETDVVGVVDTVLLCLQPGSGDTLQFMKSGIVEIPHLVAVTKGDLGEVADRAVREARLALETAAAVSGETAAEIVLVSASDGERGVAPLVARLDARHAMLDGSGALAAARTVQRERWVADALVERFGREGAARALALSLEPGLSPFRAVARRAGWVLSRLDAR